MGRRYHANSCPFYKYGLILLPAWISIHTLNKVCDEISYLFLNFNGCNVEVWEWISNYLPRFIMVVISYPCWD